MSLVPRPTKMMQYICYTQLLSRIEHTHTRKYNKKVNRSIDFNNFLLSWIHMNWGVAFAVLCFVLFSFSCTVLQPCCKRVQVPKVAKQTTTTEIQNKRQTSYSTCVYRKRTRARERKNNTILMSKINNNALISNARKVLCRRCCCCFQLKKHYGCYGRISFLGCGIWFATMDKYQEC